MSSAAVGRSVGREIRAAVLACVATVMTMLVISPLVADRDWLRPVLLVVAAVGLTAAVGAVAGWPRLLTPPACLLAALVIVTALIVPAQAALLGFLPTPASLEALWLLVQDGVATANQVEPPAPTSTGITSLLTVSGGLVTVATVTLAGPLHRPGVAGLPLLLVVCVATALSPSGIGVQGFLLAGVGYLALALCDADERLRSWGSQLQRRGRDGRAAPSGVAESLSRPALAAATGALAAGLLVPLVVPGISGDGLRQLVDDRFGEGGARSVSSVNPYLSIRDNLDLPDDVPVVRYRTDDPTPDPLRLVTADSFDLETGVWAPTLAPIPGDQDVAGGMPDPPGTSPELLSAAPTYATEYSVVGLSQNELPLPYPVRSIEAPGTWLYDATTLNVIAQERPEGDFDYDVVSYDITPSPGDLAVAGTQADGLDPRWRELPAGLPEVVGQTAAEVVADAGATTPYAQAEALQDFFRSTGGFEYSLEAPRTTDGDALTAFLTERRGYCVQYASTMALMARGLGVPARIAVGFLPGSRTGLGEYTVSLQDAHAWPELYFDGIGWVRFEPTPSDRTGTAPPWTSTEQGEDGETPEAGEAAEQEPEAAPQLPDEADLPAPLPGEVPGAAAGSGPSPLAVAGWAAAVVAVAVLLLLVPRSWRALRSERRRRAAGSDPALAALAVWAELRERLGDLGAAAGGATVRRQQAELLEREELGPAARAALGRLVEAAERALYAVEPAPATSLDDDARTVLDAVAGDRDTLTRWRARWLPPLSPTHRSGVWPGGQRQQRRPRVPSATAR